MNNLFTESILKLFALKLLGAIVIIAIGFPIANAITGFIKKRMEARKTDPSLSSFAGQATSMLLKVLVVLTAATVAGVQITSFVAILGAMAFAVGLAFQGSLANFAGGVLILIIRPFKVGDFISALGETGSVEEIGIVYTTIVTPDNKVIVLPNGGLANASITNFSTKDLRRVDLVIGASYDAPVEKTKNAIESVLESHELILKTPEWMVRLGNHNASSLDYTVRAWVNSADYWTVHFDLIEKIKEKLDAEGIEIPYNKLDVNLIQQENKA